MASKKIQLYTDRANTIEASPETSANCVILSDGNDLQKVLDNDLTNPTVVHEETSFKVGVGDIDVSSSVVDGEVGRMVIKGKTYQNILPEPSTHVLTNNKEMFKVNEGLDPNVEVVDAVSKSAILSGNTLVNIDSCYTNNDFISFNNATIDSDGWITITANGNYLNAFPKMNNLIKPSTKYLAIIEVKENTLDGKFMPFTKWGEDTCFTTNFQDMNNSNSWVINAKAKGVFKSFLLTKDDYANANILERSYVDVACTTGSITYRTMLIEYQQGMENWDIPFFRGMQSVKMPVLRTTGKNLFDYSSHPITLEKLAYADGQQVYWTGYIGVKTYVPVKENTTYTYSNDINVGIHFGLVFYDDDKSVLSYINNFKTNNSFTSFTTPKGCKFIRFAMETQTIPQWIQLEEATSPTSYEPYKSNILHTPEEVVLKGLGDVQDTLNVNTGEYVQRVKEVIYTGEEDGWSSSQMLVTPNNISFYIPLDNHLDNTDNPTMRELVKDNLGFTNNCRSATVNEPSLDGKKGFSIHNNGNVYFTIPTSECANLDAWKSRLRTQPLVLQYPVKNPIIKTVDLSTSGNWEKVVLDGSENWESRNGGTKYSYTITNIFDSEGADGFCDTFKFIARGSSNNQQEECVTSANTNNSLSLFTNNESLSSVGKLKTYLQSNPITVWYQTANHKDSTQVKQPIFFKDGHIQLSSGADNSLIPTLDYQAKTSNSYVMDLMKNGVWYTMKAKSASGTLGFASSTQPLSTNGKFAVDGASFQNANKLMVINGSVEDLMILEGDLTSKTIPYFKGIKSAFEGESKIEVLSTSHNLWTGVDNYTNSGATIILKDENECIFEHHKVNDGIKVKVEDYEYQVITMSYDFEILDGEALNVGGHSRHETKAFYIDGVKATEGYHNGHVATYQNNRVYHVDHVVHINLPMGQGNVVGEREYIGIEPNRYSADTPTYCKMRVTNFQITLGNTIKGYASPKSNSTKIPLLSPLRSLPNGVCDELIIDRMKKKATLIQRVGKVVLNGSENWTQSQIRDKHYVVMLNRCSEVGIPEKYPSTLLCSHFINQQPYAYDREGINIHVNYNFHIGFLKNRLSEVSVGSCKKWLSQNPVTVYYESATPVITEVDLENFPLVYKDGRIFLNSEIAPVVEIDYNINQAQLIIGNGETLLRHEQEILDLDKLIVSFVDCEYRLRLLKFDMELSMIALAE